MELTLQEVVNWLTSKKYLLVSKGKYSLSKTFHEDKARISKETIPERVREYPITFKEAYQVTPPQKGEQWDMIFLKFIAEAKVPIRCDDGKGNYYETNKYSEDAMKVLRNAVEKRNINYDILVKSTMLYYHSSTRFKKKIGNYFIDGDWLSDYTNLLNKSQEGEQAVIDHIKQETKDGTHNPWS